VTCLSFDTPTTANEPRPLGSSTSTKEAKKADALWSLHGLKTSFSASMVS
jgi:hypothetical protein